MILYTHPMSPCAQKVRLVLAEKKLDCETRNIDLPRKENLQSWYLKLNPLGVVPTLLDGDHVVIESSLICEYIEDARPDTLPLRPPAPIQQHKMRLWMKHVDQKLHPACGAIQWPLAMRPQLQQMGREKALDLLARVVEQPRRERQMRLFKDGLEAKDVHAAIQVYCATIRHMEADLADSDWLLGPELSLADIVLAPYFQTLVQYCWTGLYEKNFPRVAAWVGRMTTRPSWHVAIAFNNAKISALNTQGKKAWPSILRHAS